MKRLLTVLVLLAAVTAALPARAEIDPDVAEGMNAAMTGDYDKALKIFTTHAAKGDPDALYSLGLMHLNGYGVPESVDKCLENWTTAADKGHVKSQHYIGWLFDKGDKVKGDPAKAAEWYGKAAEAGFWKAQWMLGKLYRDGRGVKADKTAAYKWLRAAAERNAEDAKTDLAALEKTMTAREIADGTKQSDAWLDGWRSRGSPVFY